jgi:hypothetical protein
MVKMLCDFYFLPLLANWRYTRTKNGVAIFSSENHDWVWFSIHKSVTTLL